MMWTMVPPKTWHGGQFWNFEKVGRQFWIFLKVVSRFWFFLKDIRHIWNFMEVGSHFWILILQSVSKYTTLLAENQSQHLRHALRPERRSKTDMATSRQGQDMGFDGRCRHFEGRLTRYGRWHKSVWDPSSRVWEAMRRAFSGLTRGSRRHRSRCENGDEWAGQKVSPSVILPEFGMILPARNETEQRTRHYKRCYPKFMTPFRFSQPHKTKMETERVADCWSGSTLNLDEKNGLW